MVYKSYLIQVNSISIVEIDGKCGLLYLLCKKKDFTCILDVSWCSESEDRVSLFIYLKVLSRSFSDHHLRCGGWLNFEFI